MSKSPTVPTDSTANATGDAAATERLTGTPSGAVTGGAPGGSAPTASAGRQGPGVVKRTTNNVKRALLLVIGALAALFAVFNSQKVEVHWIFGSAVSTPLIIVIAIAFVAGGLIGWIAAKLGTRSHNG